MKTISMSYDEYQEEIEAAKAKGYEEGHHTGYKKALTNMEKYYFDRSPIVFNMDLDLDFRMLIDKINKLMEKNK